VKLTIHLHLVQRLNMKGVKGVVIKMKLPGASGTQFQVERNGQILWI
jgi:hypothetical protein